MTRTLQPGPRYRAKARARRRRRVAGGLLAAIVLLLAGGYGWIASSLPKTEGRVVVSGISGAVEIFRDRRGIPHIFAGDEADAFFALGYVHAQDRLFQMDFVRLAAQGRLSEVIGPATLDHDRLMRMLDLVGQAEATLRTLEPAWIRILEAYSAGVNAFLTDHSGAWPLEFLILRRTPEPWQPRDCLLWHKLMTLQLAGNWRGELDRARLATKLAPEILEQLWPKRPTDRATTLSLAGVYRTLRLDRLADALPPPLGPSRASNEWVLAGSRTKSGKPLLVNDPHLALNAPGQWYLARIETPRLKLVGATSPGAPAVILGHNGHIAWGFTTTNADTWDLFVERLDPDDPDQYLTPHGPRPFLRRSETIKVKGEPDVVVTFRATRHGPVLSDLIPAARAAVPAEHVLALSAPSMHVADRTPAALFALNRATRWSEFVAALRDWHGPMQNIVYADREGHIGFYSPALLPRRRNGDGWLPSPGWTGTHDWDGFVPFNELPHALDPAAGRFVNANNRVVPDEYPVFITRDWDSPHRALRIAELLDARELHDIESMAAILRDKVSLFARDVLPHLRDVTPQDEASREALALLESWNGDMDRLRPEPLIFNAWMRELTGGLLRRAVGDQAGELLTERPAMIEAAVAGSSPLCMESGCAAEMSAALSRAIEDLTVAYGPDITRWRWGVAHYASFPHPLFRRIPVLERIFGFNIPTDGDFFTINRGASRIGDARAPFRHVHGAGLRAIYDLADLDRSQFMVTPGQSGNPLSPHWGDLAQDWANGLHFTIAADHSRLRTEGSLLILAPR